MWEHFQDLRTRIRNSIRRGYLLSIYNDGKLMKARVSTGEDVENDHLDVLQPVGLCAHVAPSDHAEVFTMDPGGDPSRRVVLSIIGDRASHPKPDQGEVFLYSPGDPTRYLRIKRDEGEARGRSVTARESDRETGMEISMGDLPIVIKTEKTVFVESPEGMKTVARDGVTIEVPDGRVTIEASDGVHIKGDVIIEGRLVVNGIVFNQHRHLGVQPGAGTSQGPV